MPTLIRPEQPGDFAAIDEVNRSAFEGDTEARLVAALRAAGGSDPSLSCAGSIGGRRASDRPKPRGLKARSSEHGNEECSSRPIILLLTEVDASSGFVH